MNGRQPKVSLFAKQYLDTFKTTFEYLSLMAMTPSATPDQA